MSNAPQALQKVVKVRRDYNTWVANETIEDYALRFTARGFRKWSEWRVANTAFGAASFLILEAVGATLLVNYGFINAFWAILATGLIIFLCGLPISYYAARYGVDMDLLTRGAGFGYIGSTLTSLIYATFTFIFFALEAAVMAYALDLALGIRPAIGYLLCALIVIPLVTHGITVISRVQTLTQPLWLFLLCLPYAFVLYKDPTVLKELSFYLGRYSTQGGFEWSLFGAALTVGIALITQLGEQADYLRFMPEKTAENARRWWCCVFIGGSGWVLPGIAKMLGGALLAYLAIRNEVPVELAVDPNQMYLIGFEHVIRRTDWAIILTAVFVVLSQLKINVTNAYAGSLAWSNFFARLTHSHPGRLVWVVFNILIALLLMELNVFQALSEVLGLYSNIAIAWIVAVVADLVINKPLGLSPPGVEFKRAHLYDINPVGVGTMLIASSLSIAAYLGLFGEMAKALASFIALSSALLCSPLLAWLTKGRYYLARQSATAETACVICERRYEVSDMAHCPAYQGAICSLCCALDARCNDLCKPQARLSAQWAQVLRTLLPRRLWPYIETGLAHYLLLMGAFIPFLALALGLIYYHEVHTSNVPAHILQQSFGKVFALLTVLIGIIAWWLVLTHKSRQVAQEESNRQTQLLVREIALHRRTDEQLQKAKEAADQANQAKSRYITTISHELRTPLNSILGYAQILDGDPQIPSHRQAAIKVIRRSGDHLLSLIEGTLDIARIESGKVSLDTQLIDFPAFMQQLVNMFTPQAATKGLAFHYQQQGPLPNVVRADEKRLRQILINLLANAVKFTEQGEVRFSLKYAGEMAIFTIRDSGPGMSEVELARIFEPFSRGHAAAKQTPGSGLGLTISRMLTDLMGGELLATSEPGQGSTFTVRLFLPQPHDKTVITARSALNPSGYEGDRRRILIVDNEVDDRELLINLLAPLGFELDQAASGLECLEVLPRFQPHLIFMDLAMPGIDGWETIRRIRSAYGTKTPHIAIISANAFDKGLDNDAGVAGEDFILKPVRVAELLAWLRKKLQLTWIEHTVAPPILHAETPLLPPDVYITRLLAHLDLGYIRGIHQVLDEIAALGQFASFETTLREQAQRFQLESLRITLDRYLRHHHGKS